MAETVTAPKIKLRKEIRKKVVEILKNKTDAKDLVLPNASIPPWVEELPVILVYPKSETASLYATAPRELERDLDLVIEIIAKGFEVNPLLKKPNVGQKSLEDQLDDMARQVECEMSRDETLDCNADDSILQNIEFEFDSSGNIPIGSARLTYGVTYYTMSPENVDKQDGVEDFKKINAEYNIGDDEATREANDSLDIPPT